MKKIIVTGSHGQLGSEIRELSKQFADYQFFFSDRDELNIVDKGQVDAEFAKVKPDYLINCAAYTAVDKAETDRETAFAINAQAVKNLAEACASNGTKFIHVSTDYVFDGNGSRPYKEDDPVSPVNLYGESKLKGEEEAIKGASDCIIIRTAWVYSAFGANFVKTMLRLMDARPEINVVSDQFGAPTYAADLAEAIMHIISSGKWVPGVYHFSNEGLINWYDFAVAIKELSNSSCKVNPIPTEQYPTPAKRPKYSVLDKSKIRQTFQLGLKDWKSSLQECMHKLSLQKA